MIKSKATFGAMAILGAVLMTGCATDRELDSRFAAGWRPSKSECTFGGATAMQDAYCAELAGNDDPISTMFRAFDEQFAELEKSAQ